MTTTSDTPLKRFSAFWLTLGLFFLFGLAALVFGVLTSAEDEASAADQANAERRLAILDLVNEEQAKGLAPLETETARQVPPQEAFAVVAKKLLSQKPVAVRDERQIDPAVAAAANAATAEAQDTTDSQGADAEATAPGTEEDSSTQDSTPGTPAQGASEGTEPAPSPVSEPAQPSDSPA